MQGLWDGTATTATILFLTVFPRERIRNDFCSQTGLQKQYDRSRVLGFGRSEAQRAATGRKPSAVGGKSAKTIDNSAKSGIIRGNNIAEVHDVRYIGRLDKSIYRCVTDDIQTEDVIITDVQVQHIKDRHPEDYERYFKYAEEMLKSPDYILEANKPNTAFILKHINENGKNYEMILRLKTSKDPENYKNSVITFLKVEEKRYKRYLRTKKILYKAE